MNIVEQLNGAAEKVRHNVHTYRRSAAERARRGVSQAAKGMAAARTRVDTLAGAAQRHGAEVVTLGFDRVGARVSRPAWGMAQTARLLREAIA